jgi:ribosomal protein L37AE/L43A
MTFCVLDQNCSVFDRRMETPGISYRNPLCEGCRNRSRRELYLLRYDYVDLSQLIAKRSGVSEAKIARPKPGSVPPIDVEIFTLRSVIASAARSAEDGLRRQLGMVRVPSSVKVREGYGLSDSVGFLHPRVDDVARMGPFVGLWGSEGPSEADGAQVLALFGELHRRARKACGIEPKVIRVPGVCASCSVPALRRYDDNPDRIWCHYCNLQMTAGQYHAAQRMQFAPPVTPGADPR